jgi:hypothetical protein
MYIWATFCEACTNCVLFLLPVTNSGASREIKEGLIKLNYLYQVIRGGQLYTSNIFYLENRYYFYHFGIYRGDHGPIFLKEAPPLPVTVDSYGPMAIIEVPAQPTTTIF